MPKAHTQNATLAAQIHAAIMGSVSNTLWAFVFSTSKTLSSKADPSAREAGQNERIGTTPK